jgi:hypothetical protein
MWVSNDSRKQYMEEAQMKFLTLLLRFTELDYLRNTDRYMGKN